MLGEGTAAPLVRRTVTTDGDEFMLAVPGASGQLVRTGSGADGASVTAYHLGRVHVAYLDIGFPAAAAAEGDGNALILCTMLHTPGHGTWDGTPLARGQTFVYPVGSSHHARDPAGLRFALTMVPWDLFESAADDLGVDPARTCRRHVLADAELHALFDGEPGRRLDTDLILDRTVRAVSGPDVSETGRRRRGWRDADVVHEALGYLDSSGAWSVPILALCRHLGVSERRLQLAFQHLFGIGPNAFMRHRALQAAHRVLLAADPATTIVAHVAHDHGFRHHSRFAAYYRQCYGEPPSETLQRRQRSWR